MRTGAWIGVVGCWLGACEPEVVEGTFEGPGYDDEAEVWLGDQETYLVSVSQLRVLNRPGPGGRFGELAEDVGNWLYDTEPEGWMGAGFRNIGRLNWWTLSIWENEEALVDFVFESEPHAAAVAEVGEVSKYSQFRTVEMPVSSLPPTWEEVLELLEDPDASYGDVP